ncbi:hypothetical protein EAI_16272, partial [Harpegnathos saltator]
MIRGRQARVERKGGHVEHLL